MINESNPLSGKETTLLATILLSIALMIGIDILSDAKEGAGFSHMAVELIVAFIALIGYGLVMRTSMKAAASLRRTRDDLAKSRQESEYWRQSSKTFVDGLSKAIDEQFRKWKFSPSEKEVALLLLKGLSSREIAEVRDVADKTIRAQSTAIYEKSNLAGRAELSAFFLEDLLASKVETEHVSK